MTEEEKKKALEALAANGDAQGNNTTEINSKEVDDLKDDASNKAAYNQESQQAQAAQQQQAKEEKTKDEDKSIRDDKQQSEDKEDKSFVDLFLESVAKIAAVMLEVFLDPNTKAVSDELINSTNEVANADQTAISGLMQSNDAVAQVMTVCISQLMQQYHIPELTSALMQGMGLDQNFMNGINEMVQSGQINEDLSQAGKDINETVQAVLQDKDSNVEEAKDQIEVAGKDVNEEQGKDGKEAEEQQAALQKDDKEESKEENLEGKSQIVQTYNTKDVYDATKQVNGKDTHEMEVNMDRDVKANEQIQGREEEPDPHQRPEEPDSRHA